MKQNRSYIKILKWAISFVISVGIGTFIMNILENIAINVWFARIIGAVVCCISGLIFYHLWLKQLKDK